jgi:flavorubredoxin
MHDFLHHLKLKNYQNRRVAIVENGSWAPTAGRVMRGMLEGMKNIEIVEPMVTIRSRMKENDLPAMDLLATELLA